MTALAGLAMVAQAPATADTAPPDDMPETVSTDALPTPEISGGTNGAGQGGVVWATATAGDVIFAGGNFTQATSPGGAQVPRGNLLAFDVTTGELTDFDPDLNGQVLDMAVSPDGSRLFVGGAFTTVDGAERRRIAAFDIATGELVADFAPPMTGDVDALAVTDTRIYAGGAFRGVGSVDQNYLAAFTSDGELLDWAPVATGGPVTALTVNPAGTKVAVGGYFTALNGSSDPGYGLGMVDGTTGANLPMEVNRVVRNGRPVGQDPNDETDGAITALSTDGTNVYGTGFTYQSKEGGTLEGVFAASWNDGEIAWINDCHGDAYDVAAVGDVVYAAGHTHYCENIDGVRQGPGGVGDYPYYRAIATSTEATGTITWEPDQRRYQNFEGLPSPTMLGWYPSFNAGTFTGQAQGPWTVTGNEDYVVFGGEFTRVSNQTHSGLVRFAVDSVPENPNAEGPQNFNDTYPIKVSSTEAGQVRINWGSNRDDDNENLEYRVQRRPAGDTQTTLVHQRTSFVRFWNPITMGIADTDVTPGAAYEYRVQARDAAGNTANSRWTPVTVASSGTDSAYVDAVHADEPTHWWRLGEAAGTTTAAEDEVGFQSLTTGAGVTRGTGGALSGDPDTAFTFDGTGNGTAAAGDVDTNCDRNTDYTDIPVCWPPDVFTLETWFNTTTNQGGRLVGWSGEATGSSRNSDRQLYMDDDGRIRFGLMPDDRRVAISSAPGLNDGQWHHVAATLSPAGMRLYVDGALANSRDDVTVGQHLSIGTWRLGGDTLANWPGRPTSDNFAGSLDETAVYKTSLAASRIAEHFEAGGGEPSGAPLAAFDLDYNQATRTVTVDGAASSDPGGAIMSYAWDYGDGATATGVRPAPHQYQPGRYDLTLTVTDDDGEKGSLTKAVRVLGPPVATWAISEVSGFDVEADARESIDPDGGAITSYKWDWGDGTPAQAGAVADPEHTYQAAGTYDVTLTLTDDEGQTTTSTLPVTVPNEAPVVAATATVDGMEVTVDASGTTDPDGTVAEYEFRFGGFRDVVDGPDPKATWTYTEAGTYTVRVRATDNQGARGEATVDVTVPGEASGGDNEDPTAAFSSSTDGLKVAVDGSGSTDDGSIVEYAWRFGDGGPVVRKANPRTTHTYQHPGTYQVRLTVTDDDGQTDRVVRKVTVKRTTATKTTSTLKGVKVIKKKVRGKIRVVTVWKVATPGPGNATGKVRVKFFKNKAHTKVRTKRLNQKGRVRIALGKHPRGGKLTVRARYLGDTVTRPDGARMRIRLR